MPVRHLQVTWPVVDGPNRSCQRDRAWWRYRRYRGDMRFSVVTDTTWFQAFISKLDIVSRSDRGCGRRSGAGPGL